MIKSRFNYVVSSTLLAVALVALMGCLGEDEPNDEPSQAWYNSNHPIQWWYGDDHLPGPNGHGVLAGASTSGTSSESDCWPIHMFSPDGSDSNVTYFAGYIWVNAASDVSVGLMGYVGPDEDGLEIWEWIEPLQHYSCDGNEVICAREISLGVDWAYNEVALVFDGTGNYGFFLTPFFD